jgi:hypothetical protein
MIAIESPVQQLDDLLDRIGVKLQLSATAYGLAEDRYHAIGSWLEADGSPLARFRPVIYPQGSLRIGTTVKPRGRNEYDLDLVCELQASCDDFPGPVHVLNLIERRIRDNKMYVGMVDPKRRCIRVTYADRFHLDILPACPRPEDGKHCVVVPDREAKAWKASNPRGYALWFERTAWQAREVRLKRVEPLPDQEAYRALTALQRVVQLLKRYRDVAFEKRPDLAPISIVLTTLAARHYAGHRSVSEAMATIVQGIVSSIPTSGERLYVLNPTNPLEDLSERWDSNPEAYEAFKQGVSGFGEKWRRLLYEPGGIQGSAKLLEELFGEKLTKEVIVEQTRDLSQARADGRLAIQRGSGLIVVGQTGGAVEIPRNNFYGD